jgi:outer membrane autotransporter protein
MTSSDSDITSALQAISTVDGVEQAGQQLRAEANNASYQAVVAAANHVASVIGFHQDQVRAGATGVSSGEAADGAGFWLEAFGFRGDQKERSNVDGYQADTGGFVLGGDKAVGNGDARVGAAFAYGSTGINGKGANTANRTDIDSYQGIFYGSYNAGAWYADASLGYGRHQYDTKRVVSLVGANLTGSHNANQYSAKLGFGLPIARGNTTITPLASLAYVKLDQNGYTESDRNDTGAALSVDSTKTESLRSGLGAKLSVALATGELSPTLEARAVWNHEFADTNQNITASFDDGDSFTTNGVSQSRDSANLGVGLNLKSKNGQTLSVNYDAEVKNDYVSHTAALKARFDF